MSTITFGRTTTTTNWTGIAANKCYVGRFYLSQPMSLERLYALTGQGSVSGYWKGVIYEDNAGEPDSLLGVTGAVAQASGAARAWRYGEFASPPSLTAGWYWIGIVASNGYVHLYRDTTSGTAAYSESSYASPEDPFGTHEDYTRYLCVYGYGSPSGTPPNAPTLVSPTGSAYIVVSVPQAFIWIPNYVDPDDAQSAYQLRYRIVGAPSWTTLSAVTSPYAQHVFAGGTFADGEDYEWQLMVAGKTGLWSAWSASGYFSGTSVPGTPVITDPANGSTVAETPYVAAWTAAEQEEWQFRRVADDGGDPDPSTIYSDDTAAETDTRSLSLTLSVTARWEHWQCRVMVSSVWSDWSSVRVYIDYTPPQTPTVELTCVSGTAIGGGYIQLTVTHPTPEEGDPTVVAMDILRAEGSVYVGDAIRIAKDVNPSQLYLDRQVAGNTSYTYWVQAIGDNGARATSEGAS